MEQIFPDSKEDAGGVERSSGPAKYVAAKVEAYNAAGLAPFSVRRAGSAEASDLDLGETGLAKPKLSDRSNVGVN